MATVTVTALEYIVEPDTIMTNDEILQENLNFIQLITGIGDDPLTILKWLARRRLISNTMRCLACHDYAKLYRRTSSCDKWRWQCRKDYFTCSVRQGSIFTHSKLSLKEILYFIYFWSRDMPQGDIMHELGMSSNAKNHHSTIVAWCKFIREICEAHLMENPQQLGGLDKDGQPVVVEIMEINEKDYQTWKSDSGHWQEGHWVFGAFEMRSGRCFFVEMADRTGEMLIDVIQKWLLPGTHIISDGWHRYADLKQLMAGIYTHDDATDRKRKSGDVNTQISVTSLMRAKHKFRRRHGPAASSSPSYLLEFLWRQKFKDNVFASFVTSVIDIYPV